MSRTRLAAWTGTCDRLLEAAQVDLAELVVEPRQALGDLVGERAGVGSGPVRAEVVVDGRAEGRRLAGVQPPLGVGRCDAVRQNSELPASSMYPTLPSGVTCRDPNSSKGKLGVWRDQTCKFSSPKATIRRVSTSAASE